MTSFIAGYLLIGVLLNWAYDRIIDSQEFGLDPEDESNRLNIFERIWACCAWPIFTVVFFYHFFKSAMTNGDDYDY